VPYIVEVILPLPVKSNFYYLIDENKIHQAAKGKRVLVNFGKRKIYTGIIRRRVDPKETDISQKLKYVEEILDTNPIISDKQLILFEWIAFYYMCTTGEVIRAALPHGLKPESALQVTLPPDLDWQDLDIDNATYELLELLSQNRVLGFRDLANLWQISNPYPRLLQLADKGLIHLEQKVEETYKPRMKAYYKLSDNLVDKDQLQEAFENLSRAPKQENLLIRVVSAFYQDQMTPKKEVLKELGISSSTGKSLIEKGYIEEVAIQVDRLELYGYTQKPTQIKLTPAQIQTRDEILDHIQNEPLKPVLLHGITGSGKTYIYIDLIRKCLNANQQALYLLPEITLTKQIIDRLKAELGEQVGVYHSKFNDQERVEIWRKVLNNEYQVVIGVRSAIFLPFQNLGMIIVDEEHEPSFKQFDATPRYHARDVAIYYGQLLQCPVILGSATPSFESYTNALNNKYHLVKLEQQAIQKQLPQLRFVDLRIQRKAQKTQGVFSIPLRDAIAHRLEQKEQVILFQNRRGYAPYVICETCGSVPQCINCDISLTYHKEKQQLKCHYCGYTHYNLSSCEYCGNYTLRWAGIGTEKIAEQVKELFPEARIARLDWDTTRTKMGFHHIIQRFEQQQIDILVGTQMVSKGLDFENVTLVGVINADSLLSFPDFRNYERAYQLLKQVGGRSGRSHKAGEVIIQTYSPDNVVLTHLSQKFEDFYLNDIPHRQELVYPPFARIIRIEIQHRDKSFIEQESIRLHNILKPLLGKNLLGPEFNLIPRIRNMYRMNFLIKLSKKIAPKQVRQQLLSHINHYYDQAPQKTLKIILDVDPV